MHALPGGQNPDWHSDSGSSKALFWDHLHFQNRTIWLWSEIALHYRHNPWVAGYNPINEPCDPLHHRLPAFYTRLESALREIDPHHILFLDGNTFAIEWKHFDTILPNTVYALHDYSLLGFPTGDRFKGTASQLEKLESQYLRKSSFQRENKAPVWNGEFGPVYSDPQSDPNHAEINQERYNLLGAQLSIYDKYAIPWTIWLYKDIGVQGMVYTNPTSLWNKTIAPFLEKKKELQLDAWGKHPSPQVDAVLHPLVEWIDKVCPTAKDTYPTTWATERHMSRAIMQTFMANAFSMEFALLFKDFTFEQLDEAAKSFSYEMCVQREGLNRILTDHAEVHKAA